MMYYLNIGSISGGIYQLFDRMMEYSERLLNFGIILGALGALFFISMRIWSSMARAQPIDFFPLLRPAAICLALVLFKPLVLDSLNGISMALEHGTATLFQEVDKDSKTAIETQQERIRELFVKNRDTELKEGVDPGATKSTDPALDKSMSSPDKVAAVVQDANFFQRAIIAACIDLMMILFNVGQICIRVIACFMLVILALFGPISFGLSVWDGLGGSLSAWFTRYISISLWMPICNILASLLLMVRAVILEGLAVNGVLDVYGQMIAAVSFSVCGVLCLFAIPSISDWIVAAGSSSISVISAGGHGNTAARGLKEHVAKPLVSGLGGASGAAVGAATKILGGFVKK